TAFYLVANWQTGAMRFANAGHPRPLHLRRSAGEARALFNSSRKSQAALGLVDDTVYEGTDAKLAPNDLIMLFTDGLYEVQGDNDQFYSQECVLEAVQRRLQLPAPELFDQVLQEIRNFSTEDGFVDDVCLVGVELAATALEPAPAFASTSSPS